MTILLKLLHTRKSQVGASALDVVAQARINAIFAQPLPNACISHKPVTFLES